MMRKIWRWTKRLVLFFFLSTIIVVLLYRFIPVYVTPLMVIRTVEQLADGKKVEWHHRWVPIEKMSRYMPMAVIASEDNRYMTHHGFDFEELKKVIEENKQFHRDRQGHLWGRGGGPATFSQDGRTAHPVAVCAYCRYAAQSTTIQFGGTVGVYVAPAGTDCVVDGENSTCRFYTLKPAEEKGANLRVG